MAKIIPREVEVDQKSVEALEAVEKMTAIKWALLSHSPICALEEYQSVLPYAYGCAAEVPVVKFIL